MTPLWHQRKVVVCVGTGGVGKTTVSATLAVTAAARGLRTLVMTIDPARRLAHALGIGQLNSHAHEILPQQLAPHGVVLNAPLWVMMLDVKRTFDELLVRWAPTEAQRQKILDNRIYQHFSTALAGSHEYAAVEKLYEEFTRGAYDLIVLDTPPSQNAMDFFEAPGRIIDFLEQDTFQWLLKPYQVAERFSSKLLDLGGSLIRKSLSKLAGADTLRDIADFMLGFQGMYDGFRSRSQEVKNLLASDDVAFVIVTSPLGSQRQAVAGLRKALEKAGLQASSLLVNRVRQPLCPETQQADVIAELTQRLTPNTRDAVCAAMREEMLLARRDQRTTQELARDAGGLPTICLPELPLDAHDLASLAHLHRHLHRAMQATPSNAAKERVGD